MTNLKETDAVLADLVSEYVDQLNAGRKVSPEQFLAAYPAYAAQLRPILEMGSYVRETMIEPLNAAQPDEFDSIVTRLETDAQPAVGAATNQAAGSDILNQREDCLILLLHFMKSVWNMAVWGNTKLVKLLLLLEKEADCSKLVPNFYPHYAYNFGAFDKDVPKDAEQLAARGIITRNSPASRGASGGQLGIPNQKRVDAVFELTAKGEKVALALLKAAQAKNPAIVKKIEAVVKEHGKKNADQLIAYTYRKYPKLAEKSVVRDKYLRPEEE